MWYSSRCRANFTAPRLSVRRTQRTRMQAPNDKSTRATCEWKRRKKYALKCIRERERERERDREREREREIERERLRRCYSYSHYSQSGNFSSVVPVHTHTWFHPCELGAWDVLMLFRLVSRNTKRPRGWEVPLLSLFPLGLGEKCSWFCPELTLAVSIFSLHPFPRPLWKADVLHFTATFTVEKKKEEKNKPVQSVFHLSALSERLPAIVCNLLFPACRSFFSSSSSLSITSCTATVCWTVFSCALFLFTDSSIARVTVFIVSHSTNHKVSLHSLPLPLPLDATHIVIDIICAWRHTAKLYAWWEIVSQTDEWLVDHTLTLTHAMIHRLCTLRQCSQRTKNFFSSLSLPLQCALVLAQVIARFPLVSPELSVILPHFIWSTLQFNVKFILHCLLSPLHTHCLWCTRVWRTCIHTREENTADTKRLSAECKSDEEVTRDACKVEWYK